MGPTSSSVEAKRTWGKCFKCISEVYKELTRRKKTGDVRVDAKKRLLRGTKKIEKKKGALGQRGIKKLQKLGLNNQETG